MRRSTEHLVVGATMGPAIHDVNAWRFSVIPGGVEVVADPVRFRPLLDPWGRDLRMSCGAALLNLRLAAAQIGRDAVVRLLPDSERPTLLARVRLARRRRVSRHERLLYAASLRPLPRRVPSTDKAPAVRDLNELSAAAHLEGATLVSLPTSPATALLVTSGNSPADWLRAGQALQRVLLTCAVLGVPASFLYELVDMPDGAGVLQNGEVPQALLRFGPAVGAMGQVGRDRDGQRDRHRVG